MLYPEYNSYKTQKASTKLNSLIILFLIISNFLLMNCAAPARGDESVDNPPTIKDNAIIFEHTKFNGGATNKNGDLFIQYYSEENYYYIPESILFYGLSKNDRYCFMNESSYTKRENIDIYEVIDFVGYYNIHEIYDSKNLFVSMKDDFIGGDQYLFSINSYNSIVELHNFNNYSDIKRYIWDFNDFFNLTDEDYNFPCQREIYKLNGLSLYAIAFIPYSIINQNFKDINFIKKFTFKSFDEDTYQEIKSIKFDNFIDRRIISTFFMDDSGILVTISCKVNQNPENHIFNFFNQNLQSIGNELLINSHNLLDDNNKDNLYFKPIYLKNKFVMIAHKFDNIFFDWNRWSMVYNYDIHFDLYNINVFSQVTKINDDNDDSPFKISTHRIVIVDFTKISDTKLAFINYNPIDNYVSNQNDFKNELYIKIIKIFPDYSGFEIINFDFFNLEDYIIKTPLSSFAHNGFLLFTSTAFRQKEISNPEDEINYFSMLIIFGYPNGTDSTINIYEYLSIDEEDDSNYSDEFYKFLFKNYTIENNCIRYIADNRIKLISIPEEIIIKEKKINDNDASTENEINELKSNSFMSSENKYILKQNTTLIKTSEYYYIDYQFMAKESEDVGEEIYYGRINRLKFKLCHDYCGTCNELSINIEEQKCLSCLPEYQYDYQYFQKIKDNILPLNCAPEGYYFEDNYLTSCDYENVNARHYNDIIINKKICFKANFCPSSYPNYNETTRECFYCDYERFKNGECSANNLTMDSCTQCDYECFKIGGCNFNDFNTTNDDFYERIKSGGYLTNYDGYSNMELYNGNGYAFQIITTNYEQYNLHTFNQRNFSIIDLGECTDIIKQKNSIDPNEDLVILKYENYGPVSNGNEKSVQYEVYLKNSTTKLDLSVCQETNIDIYIPIELDPETKELYESLKEQGYNLFDINDKFYHDICTLYTSPDGTDVVLLDRINEIYEKNKFDCQDNCEYSSYSPETEYLKCECKVTSGEKIETKEPTKITGKNVAKSFFNVLKYSNYKVLRCYNLVFRKITIKKNAGSILANIYFIGYIISFLIFLYKKMSYLEEEIEKLLYDDDNINRNDTARMNKDDISIYKKNSKEEDYFEEEIKENEEISEQKIEEISEEKKGNEDNKDNGDNIEVEIIQIKKKKKEPLNKTVKDNKIENNVRHSYYKKYFDNYMKGEKKIYKKKPKNNFKNNIKNNVITMKENISEHKNLSSKESKDISSKRVSIFEKEKYNSMFKNEKSRRNESEKESKKSRSVKSSKKSESEVTEKNDLTDYELNELEYEEALDLDNRNFFHIYWYLLKREHIILFTFIMKNDYNFFSIKLSKLFLAVCSDMAFNVFFFSDESMHNLYVSGGEYNFIDQFAQMVYSTIISQILQIYVNYLTMTDIHYYQLKELKKEGKLSREIILSTIKCIKIKIIVYFTSTFVFFLFFWYTASAFCAVYPNTQGIFIGDSYMSFLMGLLYPFALYLIPTALRYISLKSKKRKNLDILYSLSEKVPFF